MPKNDLHVLRISSGRHRGKVKNLQTNWKRFKTHFEKPSVEQDISYAQYLDLTQDEQSVRKARPGYIVGAQFADGIRRLANMGKRYLISFDLDTITPAQVEILDQGLSGICGYEYLRHTTRKHNPKKPRWRIHMPVSKPVDHEKANAITRILASQLFPDPQASIDAVDVVSHRFAQVSYLPSISRDQQYRCEVNEGDILDPDAFLAAFAGDWKDHTQLPMRSDEKSARPADPNRKMEDPRDKPGLIGAFCRAFDVETAIAEFIPDVYLPGESSDGHPRYSYAYGTSANGAVIYDDGLFITSHHGSDPIEGSANAWDMVRVHKFGHLDATAKEDTTPGNMPSFKAMSEFVQNHPDVRAERAALFDAFDDDEDEDDREPAAAARGSSGDARSEAVDPDIADLLGDDPAEDEAADEDTSVAGKFDAADDEDEEEAPKAKKKAPAEDPEKEWLKHLTFDKQDKLEKTKHNATVVVRNDPRIAPCIARNDMSGSPMIRRKLRFKKNPHVVQEAILDPLSGRKWSDTDTAALAVAMSAPRLLGGYETDFSNLDLQQAMLIAAEANVFNPVIDKITKVEWDGVPRVDSLFIDWLRAEDNAYHRELARVWCVAAVTRLYEPGHKFDLVPIIGGGQGGGKSSFIEMLAMGFGGLLASEFDSTQKMVESTRGRWIMEMAELKGLSRSEVEDVKQFISATSDTVRLAYRTNEEDFPRRFVIMGTTNQGEYLKDTTGNRRYCPILSPLHDGDRINFKGLEKIIPQLWAEARAIYLDMRKAQPKGWLPLNLTSEEARAEAKRLQESSREVTPAELLSDVIREWLDTPVPFSIARNGASDKFEADAGEDMLVRGAIRVTDIMVELATHPILRTARAAEKLVAQALSLVGGWERIGYDRIGMKALPTKPEAKADRASKLAKASGVVSSMNTGRVEGVVGRWFIRANPKGERKLWLPAPPREDDEDTFGGLLD